MGQAINVEIQTSKIISFDIKKKILEFEAPNDFRTPTSFVRCSTVKDVNPNSPSAAIKIPRIAKSTDNCAF